MTEDQQPAYDIADEYIIHDLETLKVLADSLRLQIIQAIGNLTPRTVKQVAKALDTPPHKLYYHVNMLEEHGIIQVVETRVVSGIIEKLYLTTAHRFMPAPELLTVESETNIEHLTMMIDSVWASTRQDFIRSARANIADLGTMNDDDATTALLAGHMMLTHDKAVEFHQRLQALFEEYSYKKMQAQIDMQQARPYQFLYTFFPLANGEDSD